MSWTLRGSGAVQAPSPMQIRDGHRSLLAGFRGFADCFFHASDGAEDLDGMRAAISFLRESLLPFARWEEGSEVAGSALAEEMTFEHAFLAVEIDALDAAVRDFAASRSAEGTGASGSLARVLRHATRLEAVLELHASKAEERESFRMAGEPTGSDSLDGGTGSSVDGSRRPRPMEGIELDRLLAGSEWGVLCTYGDDRPYGVPVSFALERGEIYVCTGPGRKQRNLERHPAVCLTVARVHDGSRWQSAVISGSVEWVTAIQERARVLRAFHRKRGTGAQVTAADIARLARARIARIRVEEISGRLCG